MTASKLAERLGGSLFYNGDPMYYNGEQLVYNGDANNAGLADPESGLTLTESFLEGEVVLTSLTDRTVPAVFAFDITGLDGTGGAMVYEQGGTGVCSYVGYRANGDFIIRCGEGALPYTDQMAYIEIPNGIDIIKGDGTMVFEFAPGNPTTVRCWWNKVALGPIVQTEVNQSNWSGAADGAYLRAGSGPSGEIDNVVVAYDTASSLRFYENQTSTV